MLHTDDLARERVLVYGQEGSGKTKAIFTIAKWMHKTRSPGIVYMMDLDYSADRMKKGFPDWEANMVIHSPDSWQDMLSVLAKWWDGAGRDDWLCPDGLGEVWTQAKDEVLTRAYGKNISEWLIEDLSGTKKKDYGRTPDAQNKLWREVGKVLVRWPGHVLGCSPAKRLWEDDQSAGSDKYRAVGFKPEGHNLLGHLFHTVLFFNGIGSGNGSTWMMSSVKDRERGLMFNKQVNDFVMDYLVGIAGWSL